MAAQYGVGKSTISDIKKSEGKIRQYVAVLDNQGVSTSRKVMRLAKEDRLEEALYLWFIQNRSQGIAVNGPLLANKAEQLHKSMEVPWQVVDGYGDFVDATESGNFLLKEKSSLLMTLELKFFERSYRTSWSRKA